MGSFASLSTLSLLLFSLRLGPEQPVTHRALLQPLAGICFEGNATVPTDALLRVVGSRDGMPTTERQVELDTKALIATRRLFSVKPVVRQSIDGPVLVFKVTERP